MFLVYKKGLKLDGANPALLTGYGGFNLVENPTFSPSGWRCSNKAWCSLRPTCAAEANTARNGTKVG